MEEPTQIDASAGSAELVSGLSVVESQPLDQRAEGYAKLYDELRKRLESDDIN